MGITVIKSMG